MKVIFDRVDCGEMFYYSNQQYMKLTTTTALNLHTGEHLIIGLDF
jgi:hypothetical protein